MKTQSSDLDYFAGDPPKRGYLKKIVPGIWWLRMPLPMALDHINLWLLEDNNGITIIDTGFCNSESKDVWRRTLSKLGAQRSINRVIVTHFHPDHVGHAAWLTSTHNAPLYMPRTEWLYARMLALDSGPEYMESFAQLFKKSGCPLSILDYTKKSKSFFGQFAELPPSGFHRVQNGDTLDIGNRNWKVLMGYGHSPEHACLFSEIDGLLISGDIILPRITPNIGVYPDQPEADPLSDYYQTLREFSLLPSGIKVLPSHNEPFEGLHTRLSSLIDHHDIRLEWALEACKRPTNAWDVAQKLFKRPLTPGSTLFAMPETLAHLNTLITRKKIVRSTESNGIWSFQSI